MPAEKATSYLVLRKTAYSETSLVVAGISPELGQVHFLIQGARRLSRTHFPVVDLYRLLEVRFRPGHSDLHRLREVDLVEDLGMVSAGYEAYLAAGWLSRLVLGNVLEGMEQPRLFHAVCLALRRLGDAARKHLGSMPIEATLTGVCMVCLDEGGWLAFHGVRGDSARRSAMLLDMGEGRGEAPKLTARNWQQMLRWAIGLLQASECHVPELPAALGQ